MPFPSFPSPPALFPTFLVPALKFRRRKSSTDSNASNISTDNTATISSTVYTPGEFPQTYLSGHSSRLRCSRCLSDLALADQVVSKGFTGRHGRAFLVSPTLSAISPEPVRALSPKAKNDALPNLPNTYTHKPVPRQLVTGAHTVSDISCAQCGSVLGWKYVAAEEESQKYKVGKFILETKRVCRTGCWEDDADDIEPPVQIHEYPRRLTRFEEDEVEFDSQDEEECEDLFMGIWTPQSAAKRRRMKLFGRE